MAHNAPNLLLQSNAIRDLNMQHSIPFKQLRRINGPMTRSSNHQNYIFALLVNKGCRELQHGLCVIYTTFENHHFPSSFELEKVFSNWKDYVKEHKNANNYKFE